MLTSVRLLTMTRYTLKHSIRIERIPNRLSVIASSSMNRPRLSDSSARIRSDEHVEGIYISKGHILRFQRPHHFGI